MNVTAFVVTVWELQYTEKRILNVYECVVMSGEGNIERN